jgi:hypothetical protein
VVWKQRCWPLSWLGRQNLPVFLVAAADDDFDDYIVGPGFRDGGVDELDGGAFEDECFFHCYGFYMSGVWNVVHWGGF